MEYQLEIKGKVRDCFTVKLCDIEQPYLIIHNSDRLSAFNHYVCDVDGKGHILMLQNIWWMDKTKHIIPNHFITNIGNNLIVKKCKRIPLEVIVQGYVTGFLWIDYNNKNSYGLPPYLSENQKLENCIITPTAEDNPISPEEIVSSNLLSQNEWDYIAKKAIELFECGTKIAQEKDLILVDTKYEFGFNNDGEIILIDEIHTSDSSRYLGTGAKKFDKDIMRDWLLENKGIEVPSDIKKAVFGGYQLLYNLLTSPKEAESKCIISHNDIDSSIKYIKSIADTVVILAGSISDSKHVMEIVKELTKVNIISAVYYASAHRETEKVLEILKKYDKGVIYVTVAGMSNALSGVVSANVKCPVIACPPFKDKMDMLVNINSTLQCPKGVPVMTILNVANVALSCRRMFAL